jgi:hypothetical protein
VDGLCQCLPFDYDISEGRVGRYWELYVDIFNHIEWDARVKQDGRQFRCYDDLRFYAEYDTSQGATLPPGVDRQNLRSAKCSIEESDPSGSSKRLTISGISDTNFKLFDNRWYSWNINVDYLDRQCTPVNSNDLKIYSENSVVILLRP